MQRESITNRISIIIPIYKAEHTIERCIDSVIHQTFANLEIILIDDGSPDRCPEICDRYARIDNRIRVVHQANKGLGAARNSGMAIMTGEYLFFLDADDYIVPESIATLYARAATTGADITTGNVRESRGKNRLREAPSFSREKLLPEDEKKPQIRYELFYDPGYAVIVWNKLYQVGFLRKYQIVFDEKLTFCEDRVFNTKCFIHHPHIQLVNEYTYYYCTDASTITRSRIHHPVEKSIHALEELYRYFETNNVLNENEDLLAWFVFGHINQIARNIVIHCDHVYKEIRDFLVAYKKNDLVRRYIAEIGSGKHMDSSTRKSWKRYAKALSRLYNRNVDSITALIVYLRFKLMERRSAHIEETTI